MTAEPPVSNPPGRTTVFRVPTLFVVALITMWLLGMHAVIEGVRAIDIIRSPLSESLSSFDSNNVADAAQRAFVEGVSKHSGVTLPLGIAQLLLGALLAIVSIRALFGRRGSRSFALQVLAANALLAVVGYLLHDPVRAAVVESIVVGVLDQRPPELGRAEFEAAARTNLMWGFRFWLTAQLVGFGFAAFVMTRRRMRHLFSHSDQAMDSNRP